MSFYCFILRDVLSFKHDIPSMHRSRRSSFPASSLPLRPLLVSLYSGSSSFPVLITLLEHLIDVGNFLFLVSRFLDGIPPGIVVVQIATAGRSSFLVGYFSIVLLGRPTVRSRGSPPSNNNRPVKGTIIVSPLLHLGISQLLSCEPSMNYELRCERSPSLLVFLYVGDLPVSLNNTFPA